MIERIAIGRPDWWKAEWLFRSGRLR